jgi:glyoxylase-like metal-dependent hydrolase (beta-lactamase superfamily II)
MNSDGPPQSISWRPVRDGVYVTSLEPVGANCGLVVGTSGALLVDAGSSPAQGAALRASVAQLTDVPLRAVVVTHHHWDHAYGLGAFADVETRTVRLDDRPVHTYTMTNDINYIEPKARVY